MTEEQVSQAGFDLHCAMTSAMFHALMAYKFGDADCLERAKRHIRAVMVPTCDAVDEAQDAPHDPE